MDDAELLILDEAPSAAAQRARRRHWEVLGVCASVVVLALALEVLPDRQHIAFRGFADYPLPHVCTARTWWGLKCPGCGLTRSVVYLAHADWHASLRAHRLGWMMATLILFQFPYRLLALRRPERPWFGPRACEAIAIIVVGLLVASWLVDLAAGRAPANSAPRPTWRL